MNWRIGYFMKATPGVYGVIRDALPPGCELVTLHNGDDPLQAVARLHVLIAGKVTRSLIDAAPDLRLIMTPGVGYDGVDLEAAAARGIPVAPTICGNSTEVAEHTLLLMLAVSRRLTELDAALRRGEWMMWDRRLSCFNLSGKTLGLIGFGRIGREVAKRAAGFEMTVQHHDPESPESVPLDDLLGTSDFLSLHVPLTPGTRKLLNRENLQAVKQDSILINTSRGEAVEEAAVIEALCSGRLAGAGLDVFETEPPDRSNPLLSLPNVVLTPHVASGTVDGLRVKARRYAENVRLVFAGQPPIDAVLA